MKQISFLGTTDYRESTYRFSRETVTNRFFPVAAARALRPTQLLLFVTEAAYSKHYESIRDELDGVTDVAPVFIPEGKSEDELWQIFDALTGQLERGDRVIFDITLGFRSLPLLAIIAAGYLRVAKDVEIEQLIYGAWDAQVDGVTPVFDLSPFLTLLAWTGATDKFLKTGNAAELVEQLRLAHSEPHRLQLGTRDERPRSLTGLAGALEGISLGMRLQRPFDVLRSAATLGDRIDRARPEIARWAPPFGLLLDQTRQAYAPLAHTAPETNATASVAAQLALIRWHVEKRQYVQAITLSREWMVSYLCWRLRWDVIGDRTFAEHELNAGSIAKQKGERVPPALRSVAEHDTLTDLWSGLRDVRNDVAHCGMRPDPMPAKTIVKRAEAIANDLAALWEEAPQ